MRKTELIFGLCAGAAGIALAVMSLFSLLPYQPGSDNASQAYALICLGANVIGTIGALLIQKSNIFGASAMAVSMLALMFFGFPWQSLPAVLYIISIVMAVVPVKAAKKEH